MPWYGGGAVCGKSDNVDMIIYWTQAADQPPAIRVFDIASKTGSCIVEFTKLQTKVEIGSTQLITWTKGGKKRRGALLLPKNREGQVPAIMRVYGGSMQSQNVRFFGLSLSAADNHQLFASHGYAVFLPDLPMARRPNGKLEITDGIENLLLTRLQSILYRFRQNRDYRPFFWRLFNTDCYYEITAF
ncbi:S9 family peptidase [Lentibacillus sp. CBA3610]|uniref:alpha/beta hydrolase family protein n=1 Tax=Lentibacillus sp. CBA3610 TaxID=2518176 RepID=UPI0015951D1F|nr:hypothetical protein [Lentibacillus sp. CBA3610]QKY70555.1 hypothetical protein Len3610_14010 [Lentibacillus sp. CBA3610]